MRHVNKEKDRIERDRLEGDGMERDGKRRKETMLEMYDVVSLKSDITMMLTLPGNWLTWLAWLTYLRWDRRRRR